MKVGSNSTFIVTNDEIMIEATRSATVTIRPNLLFLQKSFFNFQFSFDSLLAIQIALEFKSHILLKRNSIEEEMKN